VGGPVTVVNDADAAGVAEIRFGAGKDRKGVVILLTLGTGIGSAIFLDGKLIPNTEFGHLMIRGKQAEKRASEKVREEKKLSWQQWAVRLSEFLNEMEKLFSPDLFIMGGGISKKADKFFPYLTTKTEVIVVPAQMRNEAGIIGAAYLAHVSTQ
jgi:polyphosphate glucokinase